MAEWVANVGGGRRTPETQFLRGKGERRGVFLRVALNPTDPPEDPHPLPVLNPVAELRTLEEQFVQSWKMQALGQLAGGAAHNFNNLLMAIFGDSDLLLLRHRRGDQDSADLDKIRQNVNWTASLVGQLLAFPSRQSMLPAALHLRAVLSDVTHLPTSSSATGSASSSITRSP